MTTAQRFGANLTHLRRASGMTQAQLASLCELHRSEVSLLERGGREPRLATIVKFAGALAVDLGACCGPFVSLKALLPR